MSRWTHEWAMPSPDTLTMLDYGLGASIWTAGTFLAVRLGGPLGLTLLAGGFLIISVGTFAVSRRRQRHRSISACLACTVGMSGATMGMFAWPRV